MSRYIIPARNPNHEVVAGWDNPLQTFFAIVRDLNIAAENDMAMDAIDLAECNGVSRDDPVFDYEEKDDVIFWIGTRPNEITVAGSLSDQLFKRGYINNIPDHVFVSLLSDQHNRTEPTLTQKLGLATVEGMTDEPKGD